MVWFLSENSDLKRKRSKIKIKLINRRLNTEAAVNFYNSPKMKYIFEKVHTESSVTTTVTCCAFVYCPTTDRRRLIIIIIIIDVV